MASWQRSVARRAVRDFRDLIVKAQASGLFWKRFGKGKPVPPWRLRNGMPKKKPNRAGRDEHAARIRQVLTNSLDAAERMTTP